MDNAYPTRVYLVWLNGWGIYGLMGGAFMVLWGICSLEKNTGLRGVATLFRSSHDHRFPATVH